MIDCPRVWGDVRLYERLPRFDTYRELVYLPLNLGIAYDQDPNWGLYHRDGRLIDAGALRRQGHLLGQSKMHPVLAAGECSFDRAPEDDYVYGGLIHGHYGHFITTTLPRLWFLSDAALGDRKIVFHAVGKDHINISFIRYCFEALGIAPESVVVLDRPTIIPSMVVPEPALEEQSYVHRVFAELGHRIGNHLVAPQNSPATTGIGYLSKSLLNNGVTRFVGEDVLERYLESHGVDIIHPESLNLREQVLLFRHYKTIISPVGSALHTSIFSSGGARVVSYSAVSFVNSNFLLIDKANNNRVIYKCLADDPSIDHGKDGFITSLTVDQPERVAEELITIACGL